MFGFNFGLLSVERGFAEGCGMLPILRRGLLYGLVWWSALHLHGRSHHREGCVKALILRIINWQTDRTTTFLWVMVTLYSCPSKIAPDCNSRFTKMNQL